MECRTPPPAIRPIFTFEVIAPPFDLQDDCSRPSENVMSRSNTLPSRQLRTAIAANAAAGGTIALLLFLAPHLASRSFGLAVVPVLGGCVLLGAYAIALLWLASGVADVRRFVILVFVGNGFWIAGCLALLAMNRTELTLFGSAALLVQSVVAVAGMVALALGLRQSREPLPRNARVDWKGTL